MKRIRKYEILLEECITYPQIKLKYDYTGIHDGHNSGATLIKDGKIFTLFLKKELQELKMK